MTREHSNTKFPTPILVDGELRVGERDLAETLGFADPVTIRKLIRRHAAYLERLGILATVARNHDGGRGRPFEEYFLTEEQASYIGMVCQTPQAAEGRINLILGFKAMKKELEARRAGYAPDTPALTAIADALARLADAMAAQAERIDRLEAVSTVPDAQSVVTRGLAAPKVPLMARIEKQGNLFGLEDDLGLLAAFQPVAQYLDLSAIPPRRRFVVAGRAAQSCASWLVKNGMTGFVRGSSETGRLLFHPEGVAAWKNATGKAAA